MGDKQRIFNVVAMHLLTQNKKSRGEFSENCLYRGPKGLKCAIGCLIPDSVYDPDLEGPLRRAVHETLPYWTGGENILLFQLQSIHDKSKPDHWRALLIALGKKCDLDTSVCEGGDNG